MDKEQKKYDVFISYSHEDKIIAEGICGYLESNKVRCFIDYRDIPKGANWPSIIPHAIRNSGLMLAVFSKDFNASEQTDNEISIAANRKIPVLVFRITEDSFDGTKEYFLTKSNWIEAFPEPEKCFGELYRNVCILLGINNESASAPSAGTVIPKTETSIKGEEYVQKGLKILHDEDGDREMATYNFRKAAKEGHPEGEYRLGMAYYNGNGIPQSWENSMIWLKKAADDGHAKAMEDLAKIYRYGIGTERNTMRALELYTQSAELGNGKAMKILGKVFHTGELGVQDEQRSIIYYEHAFETLYDQAMGENDGEAQYELGNSYLDGDGVKQSYSQAIKMYQRAIANNIAAAYNALGLCYGYGTGLGVAKDYKKEFELQLKAAELGLPIAMKNVAHKYRNGEGVEKDENKYLEWIRRSAECGNAGAQCSIGIDYWVGEIVEKNLQQAQKWFEKAISSGDYNAMSCLGGMYENEDIKDSDGKQKAFQLYKQAAMLGNVTSYLYVANCYYRGSGTEENDIEALRWYNKVAEIYENMKEKGEGHFTEESGAGTVSFCDFKNYQESFATAFENLAWIYRNSKTVEHNANLAIKWENISKKLKGEDVDVKQLEDIKQLEDAARNNNVEAVDKLLNIFEANMDELKLIEWATYAVEHKIFVKEADRLNGKDHVELVLKKANVANHQVYVDYIKAYLDTGDCYNNYALHNAACEEYKKGNLTLSKENWELIRNDAQSITGLGDSDLFGAGYLRARREHFDILFPGYRPSAIAEGDFSNERDFRLFYAANTDFRDDQLVNDMGIGIYDMFKKDKSYHKVVELQNGEIVHAGNFDKAINNFIYAYNNLCEENPSIQKEKIDDFQFSMLVPFCSPGIIQNYCMQIMKALISVRGLFKDKWQEVLSSLRDQDKLLDIAEVTKDDNLQLLLIEYVELQIEADGIFTYAKKLSLLYFDNDKKGIATELNNYIKSLDDNGIAHDLPFFTEDNLPAGCCYSDDEDDSGDESEEDASEDEYEDEYEEVQHTDTSNAAKAEELCNTGDDYYYGRNGKQKDYAEAVKYFVQAAELGYTYAQYSLAYCYEKGQGVEANEAESARWYGKAAEQGHASSQCSYGLCCEFGRGVAKNLTEAVKWYRKAAEQGEKYAQCNLGYCYLKAIGTVMDTTEAVKWFKKSAAQDHARAQELLGDCYYQGNGVGKDIQQAKQWYEKAAKQGRESAKNSLEKILQEEKDAQSGLNGSIEELKKKGNDYFDAEKYAEALPYYTKAAELGDAHCQCNLGFLYDLAKGVAQDYAEAVKWYRKAADQGNEYAQCNLGYMYEKARGVKQDYAEAMKWYRKAADQGNLRAINNIGYMYDTALGVAQDYAEAVKWYRKAAEKGYDYSQNNLGIMYENGRGVPKDISQAKAWYEKAAKQGYELAKKNLDRILEEEKNSRLHVVRNGNLYGYANQSGNIVIPCQYSKAEEFVDGVGLVWKDKVMGAIDEKGKYFFDCKISCVAARYLGHRLIKAQNGGSKLYRIFNLNGNDVEYELFSEMGDQFVNGYLYAAKYRVFGKDKPGKIDTNGKFKED